MSKDKLDSPFVLKPHRIYNYTHLIALLRLKQDKLRSFLPKMAVSPFSQVLGKESEKFDVDRVIEGFLHQKLVDKFEEYQRREEKTLDDVVSARIKEIKRDNEQTVFNLKVGNIRDISETLFTNPTFSTFKDWMLMDIWHCLLKRMGPLEILHYVYFRHIQFFMADTSLSYDDDASIEKVVQEFVKKRFNCEEFSMESYESRYLWAEIFVLFRLGKLALVKGLLSKYEIFFEFMSQKFRTNFLEYIDGRTVVINTSLSRKEDRFKRFFFELIEGKDTMDPLVISTAEDYLWRRVVECSDEKALGQLAEVAEKFVDVRVRLLTYIVCGSYKRAIETLLKSDFSLATKFFFLREICLEQQLDSKENRECDLATVNSVFLNFLFNIASQMPSKEHKVKLIEMLKPYPGYHTVVPRYIIRYGILDILSGTKPSDVVDFSLDAEISERVVEELQARGDKSRLMQLCHLLPEDATGRLIADVLEEAILTDETIDTKIVEKNLAKLDTREYERTRALYEFYQFSNTGTIGALRSTILFAVDADLREYRFVIEKIFPKVVEVIRAEKDREMARHLFKVCGLLELSEDCCARATNELVGII